MNNPQEKLETFIYNLDLQLDDLERLAAGKKIQLFFDTGHLVSAVTGLHDFYSQLGRFRHARFENPTTLVTCLAASNWLGEIRLLPPHQAEFLRKWEFGFYLGEIRRPEILARQFLRDVGYTDNRWTSRRSLSELSNEQIRGIILDQAPSAPRFFKAVQSIVPWQRRMAKMLEEEALSFQSTSEDYERIIESEWPEKLAELFDEKRKDKSINNVADALAIAILIEKVRQFKTKETDILPILFPSDLILDALSDQEVRQELTYGNTPDQRPITAVKDWMYFVFKVTFSNVGNGRYFHKTSSDTQSQLKSLRHEVATMLKDEISIDAVAEKKAFGKPLSQLIDEIDQLSFLENVWLKTKAPADLRSAVREIIEAREEFKQSKRFQDQATRILKDGRRTLSANVGEIEWLIKMWSGLEKHATRLREETFSDDLQTRDFFRDRGLLRYSFPEKPRSTIDDLLRGLIQGMAIKDVRKLLINACLRAIKDPQGERDNLVLGAAILLALGMESELIGLLERVDPQLPHFSLKIAYAEQIFRQRENRQRGESLLEELKLEYEETSRKAKKSDIAIGMAYLMFRLWLLKGGRVKWRPMDAAETLEQPGPLTQGFINDAISYSEQAYDGLSKSRDFKKKAYALNNYLYYLVEGGPDSRIPHMIEAAKGLTGFAGKPQYWQYRFDDTLARFFHRMATLKTNEQDWKTSIESAHEHVEKACKKAYGDPTPLGYSSKIDIAMEAGFGAILKPKRPPRTIKIKSERLIKANKSASKLIRAHKRSR